MKNKATSHKKTEVINLCDLCGSKNYTEFLKTPDRNYQTGDYCYVQCKNCKLVWLTPRPVGKELAKHYPDNYRPYKKYPKTNNLQKLIRFLIKKNKFVAKILIADQLFFWPKSKILDVGPGSGFYLHILKEWGWDVTGLELNPKAVRMVKDSGFSEIYQGDMSSHNFKKNSFDVVRYSHVMEHVPSPKEELQMVKGVLKKGGKIFIIVPNIDSFFYKIFKDYWYPLEAPRHFYQFSPTTISKLLKKSGFGKIKIKYCQPPHTFLWSVFYKIGLNKSDIRFGYLVIPLTIILKFAEILKKTDVIEVVAQKN